MYIQNNLWNKRATLLKIYYKCETDLNYLYWIKLLLDLKNQLFVNSIFKLNVILLQIFSSFSSNLVYPVSDKWVWCIIYKHTSHPRKANKKNISIYVSFCKIKWSYEEKSNLPFWVVHFKIISLSSIWSMFKWNEPLLKICKRITFSLKIELTN
jgi:hypothetical protein